MTSDPTAEQVSAMLADTERVIDVLIDAYKGFVAVDPGDTDEGALGGVGMIFQGLELGPANVCVLVSLMARRLATGASR